MSTTTFTRTTTRRANRPAVKGRPVVTGPLGRPANLASPGVLSRGRVGRELGSVASATAPAATVQVDWELTNRGILVILLGLLTVFAIGLVVVISTLWTVANTPAPNEGADVAVVAVSTR